MNREQPRLFYFLIYNNEIPSKYKINNNIQPEMTKLTLISINDYQRKKIYK